MAEDRHGLHDHTRHRDGRRDVRRDFRRALKVVPGLDPDEWTQRDLRHSLVSLLSDAGVPIEEISRLIGHSATTVAELVYRHQLRPLIQTGATIMDGPVREPAQRLEIGAECPPRVRPEVK